MPAVEHDAAVQQIARRRGGVLTRAQALELGLTPAQVATALRTERWRTVRYGVHVPGPDLPEPGTSARTAGGGRGPAAAPAGPSVRRDGRGAARPAAPAPACRTAGARRTAPGRPARSGPLPALRVSDDDLTHVGGLRATTLARTAVDVARRGSVLAGVVAFDGALQRRVPASASASALAACARAPGTATARRALALARPGAESAIESLGRFQMHGQGLPEPSCRWSCTTRTAFSPASTTCGGLSGWWGRPTGSRSTTHRRC